MEGKGGGITVLQFQAKLKLSLFEFFSYFQGSIFCFTLGYFFCPVLSQKGNFAPRSCHVMLQELSVGMLNVFRKC